MAATPLTTFRFAPELVAAVDEAATGRGLNRSDFVRVAIAHELERSVEDLALEDGGSDG